MDIKITVKQKTGICHNCGGQADMKHITSDEVILCKQCWDDLLPEMLECDGNA